jgi:hypothetical protein
MSEQTAYAPALLNLFKFILQSPGYAQRLKKHVRAVSRDKSGLASRVEFSSGQRVFHMPWQFCRQDAMLLILHLVRAVCERCRRAGRT